MCANMSVAVQCATASQKQCVGRKLSEKHCFREAVAHSGEMRVGSPLGKQGGHSPPEKRRPSEIPPIENARTGEGMNGNWRSVRIIGWLGVARNKKFPYTTQLSRPKEFRVCRRSIGSRSFMRLKELGNLRRFCPYTPVLFYTLRKMPSVRDPHGKRPTVRFP